MQLFINPGVQYILLSALGFALMSACVKAVSAYNIPVLEVVAARALISLFLSYVVIKRKQLSVWGHDKPLLLARGVVGTLALMCLYYSVTTLPLAKATVLQFTFPVFTALIAVLFLKESLRWSMLACIFLSILGVVLMMQPDKLFNAADDLPLLSVGIALLGALGSAVAYVIVRRLSHSDDASVIIFYFPLIALPVSAVALGGDFVMPSWEALLLLVLIGLFTQVGQIGLTKAMAVERAGKVAAYAYVQVVFAAILGWVFFTEVPTLWTLLGGSLIVAGALINTINKA